MSNKNPIPKKHRDEFVAYVEMADDDTAPDGAWFARIEQACLEFLDLKKLRGCQNSAAHQYLRLKYPEH